MLPTSKRHGSGVPTGKLGDRRVQFTGRSPISIRRKIGKRSVRPRADPPGRPGFRRRNRKGGHGGRPELSLVETTRFAPYNQSLALGASGVKKERDRPENLGVAPVRLELTTSKVRT